MSEENIVIAIYATRPQAEKALDDLLRFGFDSNGLSVIGQGEHAAEQVMRYHKVYVAPRARNRALWGTLSEFEPPADTLVAWKRSGFFSIPGIGPVLVAGPLVLGIAAALNGTAAPLKGLSEVGRGLYSIGVPAGSVAHYESAIKSDRFLLLVHSTSVKVETIKALVRLALPLEVCAHPVGLQRAFSASR